jgi:hypothetical protein
MILRRGPRDEGQFRRCPVQPDFVGEGDHVACNPLYVNRLDGIGLVSVSLRGQENTHYWQH